MGNLPKISNHVARLPRSGFDMGQSFAFTSSTGMLLPVYYDQLNVGETVYLNGSLFARTQPLVNSAIADVDVYLDWFFVPIPMLYQLFPTIRYQTNDYFSSAFYMEMATYGNILPLCDIDVIVANPNIYASSTDMAISSQDGYDVSFDCYGKQTFRLLNHLGFNPYGIFNGDVIGAPLYKNESNPTVFPLMPLAYQAIFQNHYRLDDRELRNQMCCNVDDLFDQQSNPSHDRTRGSGLFMLRYRPRHLDYFTDVKVSPIASSMNLLAGDDPLTGSNLQPGVLLAQVDNFLSDTDMSSAQPSLQPRVLSQGMQPNTNASVSIMTDTNFTQSASQIRSLFAVEKLLRIVGRAKKDYDSQILAHFGYKVPHDIKHQSTKLFSQHALLHIGEVVATSDTYDSGTGSGSALGAISGKGYVNIQPRQKAFKFEAPVDGVVMCIYSAVPRFRYNRTFDKLNSLTCRLDFYTPEFDKLGMQPLFEYEVDSSAVNVSSDRVGWQLRYQQHKAKYDRCTEAFGLGRNGVNTYKSWVLSRESFYNYNASQGGYKTPKRQSFYCSPMDLNNIMALPYDPGWSTAYQTDPYLMFGTDPFINDFRANVKKVSTMSPTGEPDLDF